MSEILAATAEVGQVPVRRGRPRSISAEASILEAAYRLLAEGGLVAATIEAVARASKSSKMTIYKWWPSREALLIDAFLRQASLMLPLPEDGDPIEVLRHHASAFAEALNTEFGRVQLAVISECISNTGSAREFTNRYLKHRRDLAVRIIALGQATGSITATAPAADLYDRIYGTLFYQVIFGLHPMSADHARQLVDAVLLAA
jgi:AcrR family transcriptional regulator